MKTKRPLVIGLLIAAALVGAVAFWFSLVEGSLRLRWAKAQAQFDDNAWISPHWASHRDRLKSRGSVPAGMPTQAMLAPHDVSTIHVAGHPVVVVTPRPGATADVAPRSDKHVIFVHGGAFVYSASPNHWSLISNLVMRSGATFVVPLYPVAPENDHRAAHVFLDAVHAWLLERVAAERIVFAGDSAGGSLALNLALRTVEQRRAQPARIVLMSPWLDLSLSNPAIAEVAARDPLLGVEGLREVATWWAGGLDLRAPALSPMLAPGALVDQLAPITIYQGTDDIFWPDVQAWARAANARRPAAVDLQVFPGATHVFVVDRGLPETEQVLADWARRLR